MFIFFSIGIHSQRKILVSAKIKCFDCSRQLQMGVTYSRIRSGQRVLHVCSIRMRRTMVPACSARDIKQEQGTEPNVQCELEQLSRCLRSFSVIWEQQLFLPWWDVGRDTVRTVRCLNIENHMHSFPLLSSTPPHRPPPPQQTNTPQVKLSRREGGNMISKKLTACLQKGEPQTQDGICLSHQLSS